MPLVLGVRSSLHRTIAQVHDAETGALVASGVDEHPLPAADEHDPSVWWHGLVTAIARCGVRDIAAMAVAGELGGLLVLDSAGNPTAPALTWVSTVATADAAELARRVGPARWAKLTGSIPDASSTVAQLAWLRRTRPGAYTRAASILTPHDHLVHRLTGRLVTERGQASSTGCWSPTEGSWVLPALTAAGGRSTAAEWAERLPEILPPGERADWLGAMTFELLDLRGRPLVAPGTGIPMAQALALALQPGRVATTVRTGTVVTACDTRPIADAGGRVRSLGATDGHHLPLLRVAAGLGTFAATCGLPATLGEVGDDAAASALESPPGANGVRATARPGAPPRAALAGLESDTSKADIACAALEAIACEVLDGRDEIADAGARIDAAPIVLSGAGPIHAALAQVLADCAATPVEVRRVDDDPAARGAAVHAAAVLTEVPIDTVATAWQHEPELVEPTHDDADLAHAVRSQNRAFRNAVRDLDAR